MEQQARATAVRQEAGQALTGSGVEVTDVVIQAAGRRRLVRVTVARDLRGLTEGDDTSPVEPLTLDEVAQATTAVSEAVDATEVMGQAPYTLEVSSPGVDEPLTAPEQFRRNVGRRVTVDLLDGRSVEGRLLAAGQGGIRLDGAQGGVPIEEISRGRVQVEFSRPDPRKDR